MTSTPSISPATAASSSFPHVVVDDRTESSDDIPLVLQDLRRFLSRAPESSTTGNGSDEIISEQQQQQQQQRSSQTSASTASLFDKSATAIPVAAIKALLGVVQRSQAETMMGLQDELKQAADILLNYSGGSGSSAGGSQSGCVITKKQRSNIALQSGCELFLKYVTRTFLELPDFEACRQLVLERGERFQMISLAARDRIAVQASDFVPHNATILTHGWSRVVAAILLQASSSSSSSSSHGGPYRKQQPPKHFQLIILEGRPDASGAKAAQSYARETNIPVRVIPDAAMGYIMETVDLVIVGAEGVLENGGIVNKMGTYALSLCAQANNKPFYVAAESYKFARLYPFHQSDLPYDNHEPLECVDTTTTVSSSPSDDSKDRTFTKIDLPPNVQVENPPVDFTPAKYITLLFTDLGVLTPSAVSDELIRLYQ